jgi:YggT family protein
LGVANFLASIVTIVINGFLLILFIRVLISWLQLDPYNPIVQFLHNVTEPILAPVRRRLPPAGMMDLSPIVVMIIAVILRTLLIQIIYSFGF